MLESATSTAASGYAASKIATALGGFIGGLSLAAFWQPERLKQHGKFAAAAMVGGISVGSAIALGGLVARQLGVDASNMDNALGIGTIVGAFCVFLINAVANYFEKRERATIFEVVQDVREARNPRKRPARSKSKTGAKSPVRKKV